MKLLVLGSDPSILNVGSPMAQRTKEYGRLVDKYTVIVPHQRDEIGRPESNIAIYGLHSPVKFLLLFKIYFFASSLLKKEQYDLISSPDAYYLGLVSLFLAKRFSLPLQVQVHGWEKNNLIRQLVSRYVLRRADGIRVVSQRLKKQLETGFKIASSKITSIPIYVDFSKIAEADTGCLNNGKTIFLTVSRLVKVKNISLQIYALKDIITKYPNCELWIVGAGPEARKLKKLSADLGLKDAVKFWGWRNDADNFYRQADIFLLTSNSEGWGMVVIEAASRQLPIIMTDVGCADEVIKNNESGIVVPVGEVKPLADAMAKLAVDDELRKSLGRQARQAVNKLPNFQQTLAAYYEGWIKILTKNNL